MSLLRQICNLSGAHPVLGNHGMPERSVVPGGTRQIDALHLAQVVARGIGQVMFQGHAGTGLLFLAGIAVASPLLAVGALVGAIFGPVVAYFLKFDRAEITDGIHGFNATLVGIALLFYLKPEPLTWGLIVAGCVVATLLTHAMRRHVTFPTYTAPFIVATWLALWVAHAMVGTSIDLKPAPPSATPSGFVTAVFDGVAEVMFGANVVTGMLFLTGIALSNWRHAVIALLGSVVGTALAYYHNDPFETISIGIYGFNAALAAIAVYLWRRSLLLPILGAAISVPLTEFFPKSLGLPTLTAPFVVASWIVLLVGSLEPLFVND